MSYEGEKARQRAYKAALNALWAENEFQVRLAHNLEDWLNAHAKERTLDVQEVKHGLTVANQRIEMTMNLIDALCDLVEGGEER